MSFRNIPRAGRNGEGSLLQDKGDEEGMCPSELAQGWNKCGSQFLLSQDPKHSAHPGLGLAAHTLGKKWDKNLLDSSLQDIPEDQSFGKLQEFCFEDHMCLFPWINWDTLVGKQEKRKSGAQSLQNLCIETPVPPGEPRISGFKG